MEVAVSIVIPVKDKNPNLEECITHCHALNYSNYEVIVVPDQPTDLINVITIPSGEVGPSEKRDLALESAKGDIIAFLDDDTYPQSDWLKNAVKPFAERKVAAVGGPAITPPADSFWQQASGLVFSSVLASGNVTYRYLPKPKREVDDYPSCNLLVRKSILKEIGGFDNQYWPGEDTHLCLRIIKDLDKKIIYTPEAAVYHHRRSLFRPHLKQVWSYALHRGYFMKKFPENSFRFAYFVPTLFVAFVVVGGIAGAFNSTWRFLYLTGLIAYLIIVLLASLRAKKPAIILAVALGIVSTHVTYGIGLIKGLITPKLKEERRS